jgi:hypothetical protein
MFLASVRLQKGCNTVFASNSWSKYDHSNSGQNYQAWVLDLEYCWTQVSHLFDCRIRPRWAFSRFDYMVNLQRVSRKVTNLDWRLFNHMVSGGCLKILITLWPRFDHYLVKYDLVDCVSFWPWIVCHSIVFSSNWIIRPESTMSGLLTMIWPLFVT